MGLSGISPMSLLLIFCIVLALFGTNKLKNIGSDLGDAIKGFRRAMHDEQEKMISSGELLITLLVALIVFGPNKLPMLAKHLGQLIFFINQFKQKAQDYLQQLLKEQKLLEGQQKAQAADVIYQMSNQPSENEKKLTE